MSQFTPFTNITPSAYTTRYQLISQVEQYADIYRYYITNSDLIELIRTTPRALYYTINETNIHLKIQTTQYSIEELYYIYLHFVQVPIEVIISRQTITPTFYKLCIYDDDNRERVPTSMVLFHQPSMTINDIHLVRSGQNLNTYEIDLFYKQKNNIL
jgi:hypothetical protein